jgi:hypothetical protein
MAEITIGGALGASMTSRNFRPAQKSSAAPAPKSTGPGADVTAKKPSAETGNDFDRALAARAAAADHPHDKTADPQAFLTAFVVALWCPWDQPPLDQFERTPAEMRAAVDLARLHAWEPGTQPH